MPTPNKRPVRKLGKHKRIIRRPVSIKKDRYLVKKAQRQASPKVHKVLPASTTSASATTTTTTTTDILSFIMRPIKRMLQGYYTYPTYTPQVANPKIESFIEKYKNIDVLQGPSHVYAYNLNGKFILLFGDIHDL